MVHSNSLKRRNNVNKYLGDKDLLKRKKAAEKRGLPELYNLSVAINQRLIDLGKNQEWLVDETQIGKATISAYYNAESLPNGINLLKLTKALQTTPDYLLGFTNTPTTDIEIKAIHDRTGLEEKSINALISLKENFPETARIVNGLLSGMNFINLIASIKKYAIDENRELYFVKNGDTPNYSAEKVGNEETNDFKFFKLTKVFDGYIREVMDILERSKGNGEHPGTQE